MLKPVEYPDVPSDDSPLGKPSPVVCPDEPVVQLVFPALLGSEDPPYQGPQPVLAVVERSGRLLPAGPALAGGILCLVLGIIPYRNVVP